MISHNTASLHLQASRAGTKLDAPSLLATSAKEIGQAFGTGTGSIFLHLGYLLLLLFLLSSIQLPVIAGNAAGELKKTALTGSGSKSKITKDSPNIFITTTLGNCGISSCSIDSKWYIVLSDCAGMVFIGLMTIWIKWKIIIYEMEHNSNKDSETGKAILSDASKVLLIENLDANIVRESDFYAYFHQFNSKTTQHKSRGNSFTKNLTLYGGRSKPKKKEEDDLNSNTMSTSGGLVRVDMLSNVEAIELDLMEQRRRCAIYLRICKAKLEWGDRTSTCAGECLSEEEWGHVMVPKMEQKLKTIETRLNALETTSDSTMNAFLWFSSQYERDYIVNKLLKLDSIQNCEDLTKDVGVRYFWSTFERCIGCSTAGRSFRMAGTSPGDGMHLATCSTHPALFPANLMHRNMKVTSKERLCWRISSIVLLIVVVGMGTAIYAGNIRGSRFTTAFLLLLVNQLVPPVVKIMVKHQRSYLRTEESDIACFLSFLVVAVNVLYFTLFSAFYSSRDGGLATWERMFTLQWYQSGGGDVLHYYMMLDCIVTPILLAMRTGYQRRTRSKKLKNAVCQEQLNQVHTGIELDYMLEYSLSLVCPAMSIVLCQGLPMLPSK
jgi:hypothetical protein